VTLDEIIKQCLQDGEDWFPHTFRDVPFLTLAMCGEAGECANLVKKFVRGSRTAEGLQDALEEELTDVFIYLMSLVGELEFDIVAKYEEKRQKNVERFGRTA